MNRRRFLALATAGLGAPLMHRPRAAAAVRANTGPFIEDMTWIEVRDAIAGGAIAALLPTGGSEENGPQMAIGKHNLIVRHCAGVIARRLGTVLVAPVLAYVPEGNFDPPDGNMTLPGTIGVSEADFAAVLRDGARSLALAGFRLICFIGDHGPSQRPQADAAAHLTEAWQSSGVRVANLDRYYDGNGEEAWLAAHGFTRAEIGEHAGLLDTAELMAIAPGAVRAGLLSPHTWPPGATGADGDPTRATAALGAHLLALKIAAGEAQLRALLAALPPRHGG